MSTANKQAQPAVSKTVTSVNGAIAQTQKKKYRLSLGLVILILSLFFNVILLGVIILGATIWMKTAPVIIQSPSKEAKKISSPTGELVDALSGSVINALPINAIGVAPGPRMKIVAEKKPVSNAWWITVKGHMKKDDVFQLVWRGAGEASGSIRATIKWDNVVKNEDGIHSFDAGHNTGGEGGGIFTLRDRDHKEVHRLEIPRGPNAPPPVAIKINSVKL